MRGKRGNKERRKGEEGRREGERKGKRDRDLQHFFTILEASPMQVGSRGLEPGSFSTIMHGLYQLCYLPAPPGQCFTIEGERERHHSTNAFPNAVGGQARLEPRSCT